MKLYASIIKLISLCPATLSHPGGQHAHAAFLNVVQAVDPALSQKLHSDDARKPFTVSPLLGLPRSNTSEVRLREGWQCSLRVTMLDADLFHAFIEHFASGGALPTIRLGDAHFGVTEILTTPGSHPQAGYTTLENLQKRLDSPAPSRWRFDFDTPTQFGWKEGHIQVMPLPRLVFGNLAGAWRALTGEDHVEAVEQFVHEHVIFGDHDLHTERLVIKNKPHPGAIGHANYLLTCDPNHLLARSLNMLAALAFFTGLGRKTTMGLGQARLKE